MSSIFRAAPLDVAALPLPEIKDDLLIHLLNGCGRDYLPPALAMQCMADYDRLAMSGDSLFASAISIIIHDEWSSIPLRKAEEIKTLLTSEATLSYISDQYGLPARMDNPFRKGNGRESSERAMANAFRAYIGTILYDAQIATTNIDRPGEEKGFEAILTYVSRLCAPLIDSLYDVEFEKDRAAEEMGDSPVSVLNKWAITNFAPPPVYVARKAVVFSGIFEPREQYEVTCKIDHGDDTWTANGVAPTILKARALASKEVLVQLTKE